MVINKGYEKRCDMDRKTDKVKITISTGTGLFYYTGWILEDVDGFLTFDDIKEGNIKLNKTNIISIKQIDGGD